MIGAIAANRRRIAAPWTGSNVSISFLGGQEYQVTKTNSGNWNAAAWFPDLRDGEFFWFERIASVARILVGGDGTFATAAPYYTFASDASDTDRPKIAISLQNASVRVVYFPL